MPQDLYALLCDVVAKWGYLGAFVVSVLGNLLPFMPVPYLAAIFLTAANFPGIDPTLLGVVSGLGGGVGKLVVYMMGRGAASVARLPEERMRALKRLLGSYGAVAAFILAATPSPDDVVMIPLGMIRYDVVKFFAAVTCGKVIISLLTAYSGRFMNVFFGGAGQLVTAVASVVVLGVVTAMVFAVDWVKVLEVVEGGG
ncbi:MAG: hypothetical protein DRJ56_06055, partial [Thermoprotei archaeon]